MKNISLLTLCRVIGQTKEDYEEKYNHGGWGKLKSTGKATYLASMIEQTLNRFANNGPYMAAFDPAVRTASRVKSGGNSKAGSFRPILTLRLYEAMELGELGDDPMTMEQLVLKENWHRVRDKVVNALHALSATPLWQNQGSMELYCLEDVSYLDAKIKEIILLGVQPLMQQQFGFNDADDYEALVHTSRSILQMDEDNNDIDGAAASLRDKIADNNEQMLAVIELAKDILKADKKEIVDLGINPYRKAMLDFWNEKVANYGLEPIKEPAKALGMGM